MSSDPNRKDAEDLDNSSEQPQESFDESDNANLYSSYGTGEFGSEHQFLHANLWESKQAALRKKQAKGELNDGEDSVYSFSDASSMLSREVQPRPLQLNFLWNLRIISICLLQVSGFLA